MAPLLPLLLLPALLPLAAAEPFPASCSKATCGDHEIRYPFWLISSGSDCGYPRLGLACENNASLILSVDSHRYRVVSVDYSKSTVAVSDAVSELDEYGSGCPRLHWNTIDHTSTWLQLTSSDSNITFLYNCTSAVELRGCREGYDIKYSYVLLDGVATGTEAYDYECEEVVVAPVLSLHKAGIMNAPRGNPPLANESFGAGGVVRAGFELMYNTHSKECDGCESSGGWCGYQRKQANGDMVFTCFCNHGSYTDHCGHKNRSKIYIVASTSSVLLLCLIILAFYY